MITLSRLNGTIVAINPDLITWIEVTPDTTVSLLGGDKIIVRESLDEVVLRVVAFRKAIGGGASQAYPPSSQVLQGAAWRRESATPERPSARPSHPTTPPIIFRK
ncbi:MAG: flagellar FlbD family protein [Deltaproteobacteria bacterium]|nr:flagellar FlbD family protein [Deltaproteobacteria bacterium]